MSALAQPNQINPANQIRWPMPDCININSVYSPQNNTCYRLDQQPPSNIQWPANCTPGQVYSPGLNTCVAQGGTANNPAGQLYDFQTNGGTNFSVPSPRTYTNANGDFINQASVMSPLPRVNIQNPMFSGGADKTGAADSAPAISAAVAWSVAHPQGNTYPAIYLPSGYYKILSTLRIPCYVHVVGDGPQASIIVAGTTSGGNWNALTVYGSGSPGYTTPVTPNMWTCPGSLQGFAVHAPGGHLYTGTLVEISQASGYTVSNLRLSNSGGRGIATMPNTERFSAFNVEVDTSRLSVVADGNEERWFNTNVASPGSSDNGAYCHSPANCPGGVFPGNQWLTAQTVSSMTADGTTLTLVINGGNNSTSNNGTSPLVVGHWFQLSGATNNPTLNAFYQITSVQNTTPIGSQYTVKAATTVNGTETAANLKFKPAILPEVQGGAIMVNGAEVELYGGSLKALWYAPGINIAGHFGGKIEGFYLEGFPLNGQPHQNPAIEDVGMPFTTTTTASVAANGASVTVASTDWAWCYVGDPADKNSAAVCNVYIFPADYAPGNSSPSAAVPGVNRNQYEKTQVEFSGQNITANLFSRWMSGSTAPNTTVWPSGSVISVTSGANYGPMQIANNHLSSINDPSPTGPWSADCVDGTNLTCAVVLLGPIPNGFSTVSRGQMQARDGVPGTAEVFVANEWWGNTATNGQTIKTFGTVNVMVVGSLSSQVAETPEVVNGQYLQNGFPSLMATTSPVDSTVAWLTWTNATTDTAASTTGALYWSLLNPAVSDPNIGTQVGSTLPVGHQFMNSHCFYDMGTSTGAPHTLTRFCFKGGPNNTGGNAGFEQDVWDTTNLKWNTTLTLPGNGGYNNYWNQTGTGPNYFAEFNSVSATSGTTFNGPGARYEFFNWWNSSASVRSGCGWKWSSQTAGTVTPTGLNYTYQCDGSGSVTVPIAIKYSAMPSGSSLDISNLSGGFKPPNQGRNALVAGTVTVSTSAAATGANYTLTNCAVAGTQGMLSVGTITAGTSFVINSSNAADTSTVCWWIH